VLEHLHESFQKTFELLEAWCEREGLDFERFREEADSPECAAELQRVDEAIDADPLMRRARCYTTGSYRIVESLGRAAPFRNWPAAVHEAIDIISGLSGIVSAKIHRAVHGLAEEDEDREWDPIQNDWNGSAKVARLAVIESRIAWETVLDAGEAPRDSPIRAIVALLDQILTGIDERFPRAMEFVRPGFDEPDVAAGARTSLAPFEPRPRR
jgi:hypothetical protein